MRSDSGLAMPQYLPPDYRKSPIGMVARQQPDKAQEGSISSAASMAGSVGKRHEESSRLVDPRRFTAQ